MNNTINNTIRVYIKKQHSKNKVPTFLTTPEDCSIISTTEYEEIREWKWSGTEDTKIISINFNNKESADTKLINGQVSEDLAILIDRIEVSGIDISDYKDKFGIYKTTNGKVLKTHGYMGFNGTYTFKFRYNPFYMKIMCFMLS